jgi:hypothetical protein
MEQACQADNTAREREQPAIHKLKMLPEVVALLNRNTVQHSIVDPDTNFLQSVKFFLEPLNDGSLPAYNIQRDLFNALVKLPIEKEALLSSGIGKVVLYYTKSKRPEVAIKRIADRLIAEWSRPILHRSDDYKKRKIATKDYDAAYVYYFIHLSSFYFIDHKSNFLLGLHNSQSALHVIPLTHSLSLNMIWIVSVSLPDPTIATEQDWKWEQQVIALHQRAHLIRIRLTLQIAQLVLAVWRPSER